MRAINSVVPTEREILKMMLKAGFDEDILEKQQFPHGLPEISISDDDTKAIYNQIVLRLKVSGLWTGN